MMPKFSAPRTERGSQSKFPGEATTRVVGEVLTCGALAETHLRRDMLHPLGEQFLKPGCWHGQADEGQLLTEDVRLGGEP